MPKINVPAENKTREEIANLLEQVHLSDCTIISADNEEIKVGNLKYILIKYYFFKVNKCILACRSPVFAAMFEHELLESRENTINIPDFDSNVLKQMLQFM